MWRVLQSFKALSLADKAVVVSVSVTSAGGVGWVVGPFSPFADAPPGAPESRVEVLDGLPTDPDTLRVVEGLVALLQTCRAVLSVSESGPGVVLWRTDSEHRGRVDEDEPVALMHNRLLEALQVCWIEPESLAQPAPAALLYGPSTIDSWRRLEGVQTRVVATQVTDMRLSRRPEPGGSATVQITLTWSAGSADATPETVISLTLPAVHGDALARAGAEDFDP